MQLLRINIDDDPIPSVSQKRMATTSTSMGAASELLPESGMSAGSEWKKAPSSDAMPLDSSDPEANIRAEAEAHARSVHVLPSGETKTRSLRCIGWRNTGDCNPDGPREPHKDLTCYDFVPNNASGYCEVEDTKSGERFRVMRHSCNVLRNRVPFRCINAPPSLDSASRHTKRYQLPTSDSPTLLSLRSLHVTESLWWSIRSWPRVRMLPFERFVTFYTARFQSKSGFDLTRWSSLLKHSPSSASSTEHVSRRYILPPDHGP